MEYLVYFLSPSSKKITKIHPVKNSSYFGKWNFQALILKSKLFFLKKSFSYILGNGNPEKKIFMFQKMETLKNPYISSLNKLNKNIETFYPPPSPKKKKKEKVNKTFLNFVAPKIINNFYYSQ